MKIKDEQKEIERKRKRAALARELRANNRAHYRKYHREYMQRYRNTKHGAERIAAATKSFREREKVRKANRKFIESLQDKEKEE